MDVHQVFLAVKTKPVTGVKLLTTHGAYFPIDKNIAFLNLSLGKTTGGNRVGKLQRILQLDKFCTDGYGDGTVFFLNNYFHMSSYQPFLMRTGSTM